ncbi:prokaryotic molybdopterin-containing oxidoreductase family, membrane subunit [Faunimonas pinastri]|uniref:Prokaryotic molybdopterin-containing oxidoreductase family, membrane subunit n=1 Tax=Faunimonas pinastri TaxID=1855383 RepID=A0A1H9LTM0_9HYPH|nr:prokaryotic molybdopterin-containing oxidoreductase family, membrane subunit [Faunimonas pinastri]
MATTKLHLTERETAARFLPREMTYDEVTRDVSEQILTKRVGRVWWIFFAISILGTGLMLASIAWLFIEGIGIWGINTSNIWGFAIANYVWWIGIGNAGTLISSMLLLTRQKWRSSINRFAEAMTLFAASIAGLFPILHLGRPYYFFWLVPYPSTMDLWPQWRSPLVWDLFAIASYLIFSILFWYTGVIPDLATMRDRARTTTGRVLYGAFALGWTGSARDWARYEKYYKAMAALGVPLVCSVHSVVGLDFAAGLAPGWQETIFPPYFVVGAMFSGFAMVVTLAIAIRWGFGLRHLITDNHLDLMGKILLMGSLIMGISYATEWFMSWYGGSDADRSVVSFEFTGPYAPWYWLMLFGNVLAPQLLWFRTARINTAILIFVAIMINVGMWLERILIVAVTPSHDQLPSQWRLYSPTIWDWSLFIGTLGFFLFMFLCFVRLVPVVSMHEVKQLAHERRSA